MPDVGMASHQMGRQRRIISACEKWWPLTGPNGVQNSADCSGFVRSVASDLGILLIGQANDIYQVIQLPPWSRLGTGEAAAELAGAAASNGKFVIGAWRETSGGHGHVAVIVDANSAAGTPAMRKRALAYWGALHGTGKKYAVHSQSWGKDKLPDVLYAARDLPS
jgi:cell wall-associated NlpC family hydrolase